MHQLKKRTGLISAVPLCVAALLLTSACTSRTESVPPDSSSMESAPVSSQASSDAGAENGTDGGSAETNPSQALYDAYFATEVQWPETYLSGDEQPQLGSGAPYDTTETRYAYSITQEGAVQRQILHRDADLGNWRSQSEEALPAALTGVSEAAVPYGHPIPVSGGKLFLIQNNATLAQADENGENLAVLYENESTISNLTAGEEIVFFLENQDTLCRLHLASGIVDKMPLADPSFMRYFPISNYTVQVFYGQAGDSYLMNFQTRESRPVGADDIDESGFLRYKIGQ